MAVDFASDREECSSDYRTAGGGDGLEAEPSDIERRRARWPSYDPSMAVRMVHGQWLHLLPRDAYSEKLFVFRRQHIGLLLALARISLAREGSPGLAVDVGANVGYTAAWLAMRSDVRHLIAVEPNPTLVPLLERNLGARGTVVHAVATRESGRSEFPLNGIDSSWSGFGNPSGMEFRLEQVPAVALDELVGEDDRVELLKIDVEGHECEVLDGATGVLQRCSPVIVIEVNKNQEGILERLNEIVGSSSRRYDSFVADADGFLRPVSIDAGEIAANDLILVPEWAVVRVD